MGDYVIVVNADKLVFTGNKLDQKVYYRHTGYPGGLKETTYRTLMETRPEFALEHAVTVSYTHLDVYKRQPCGWRLPKTASAKAKKDQTY